MRLTLTLLLCTFVLTAQNGRRLFVSSCSACHGDSGKGGRGPDLTTGDWKHGGSDEDLLRNITKGIPGTQMPAIPLPEPDARAIVAHLRELTASGVDTITGDPDAGRAVFTGRCASCHMYAGSGGILGPDLTNIRARHKSASLAKALAEPITFTEAAGGVRGVKKNEDTFTIQLMDE